MITFHLLQQDRIVLVVVRMPSPIDWYFYPTYNPVGNSPSLSEKVYRNRLSQSSPEHGPTIVFRDGWIRLGLSTVCYHLDSQLDHLLHCPPLPTIAGSWALGKLLTQPSSPCFVLSMIAANSCILQYIIGLSRGFLEKIFF